MKVPEKRCFLSSAQAEGVEALSRCEAEAEHRLMHQALFCKSQCDCECGAVFWQYGAVWRSMVSYKLLAAVSERGFVRGVVVVLVAAGRRFAHRSAVRKSRCMSTARCAAFQASASD